MPEQKPNIFAERFKEIKELAPRISKIAKENATPLYIFHKAQVSQNVRTFKSAFREEGVEINIFFATKSNPYIGLLKTVVKEGEGIDVSSRRELKLAIKAGAKKIIYTGPAKTRQDFELILKHHKKITVNLESVRELKLLSQMVRLGRTEKKTVKCGVRIFTKSQSGWTKFGIPLNMLRDFYDETKGKKGIDFCGIHFHISFNTSPEKYVATMEEVGAYMKKHFSADELKGFRYLDMGGGIVPPEFEGIYPWNPEQDMTYHKGQKDIDDIMADRFHPRFIPQETKPVEVFAADIASAYKKNILSIMPNIKLYAEPGRFVSYSSMHMALTVMDVKNGNFCITDGGNNMVGWEKYQYFYYVPIFNLSQFTDKHEIPFITYGSLCTPEDIWGYYMYTKDMPKEEDILLMPFQGAYTYTLAQNFIKEIPEVIDL